MQVEPGRPGLGGERALLHQHAAAVDRHARDGGGQPDAEEAEQHERGGELPGESDEPGVAEPDSESLLQRGAKRAQRAALPEQRGQQHAAAEGGIGRPQARRLIQPRERVQQCLGDQQARGDLEGHRHGFERVALGVEPDE